MASKVQTRTFPSIGWVFQDQMRLYSQSIRLRQPVMILCLACVMLVYAYDVQIADYVKSVFSHGSVQLASEYATILGDGAFVVILVVVFALIPRTRQFSRALFSAALYSGINVRILKVFLGRPRPGKLQPVIHGLTSPFAYDSMPSGHSATVFVLAVMLSRMYPKYTWLFYAIAVLVSLSRVIENMHWPADVVAGAIIGYVSGVQAIRCLQQSSCALDS
jgi:membrane-associated phospholipid phosphatase